MAPRISTHVQPRARRWPRVFPYSAAWRTIRTSQASRTTAAVLMDIMERKRHLLISYLTTKGLCVGDVSDEEFSRAVMQ